MADHSNIEWTDATWNPIRGIGENRWMCQRYSPGCDNCYASTMNHRWGGSEYLAAGDSRSPEVRLDLKVLAEPQRWRSPRRVFVCSMTDLFGEWITQHQVNAVLGAMLAAPQHQFQVLTKRPRRMATMLGAAYDLHSGTSDHARRFADHIWLGTSIELDRYAWRADVLCEIPAAVRFVSAEPLLGPLPSLKLEGIDWLITGGESGAHHRAIDLDWVRDLRDRCQNSGVAFLHKQHGGRTHAAGGRLLDRRTWDEFPEPRRELVHA